MQPTDLLTQRHSTRRFTDQPVPLDLLKTIITEAQRSPSWENTQPWKLYLAVGQTAAKIRNSHAAHAQAHDKSWTEVVPPKEWAAHPQANMDQWSQDLKSQLSAPDVDDFMQAQGQLFDAPAILYITIPKDASSYSVYDAGGFGNSLVLAAYNHGVDSVTAYEFIRFPAEVREQFAIPADESLLIGIGLGYATSSKVNKFQTQREPLADILQISGQ